VAQKNGEFCDSDKLAAEEAAAKKAAEEKAARDLGLFSSCIHSCVFLQAVVNVMFIALIVLLH